MKVLDFPGLWTLRPTHSSSVDPLQRDEKPWKKQVRRSFDSIKYFTNIKLLQQQLFGPCPHKSSHIPKVCWHALTLPWQSGHPNLQKSSAGRLGYDAPLKSPPSTTTAVPPFWVSIMCKCQALVVICCDLDDNTLVRILIWMIVTSSWSILMLQDPSDKSMWSIKHGRPEAGPHPHPQYSQSQHLEQGPVAQEGHLNPVHVQP